MLRKRKGQVWIETVTYTLITFVLIGLILGFAKPKIEEIQDQAIIEQTIQVLKELDYTINDISEKGAGNKRKVELSIKKGEFHILSENNTLKFFLEGNYMYSQPGQEYEESGILILTEEVGKEYHVTLQKKYKDINLTYNGEEENKKLLKGSTPYNVYITNKGGVNQTIDFQVD